MQNRHDYAVRVTWSGNRGEGTSSYKAYGRDHYVRAAGKRHEIEGSSDRAFHGDADRWNPEELVITALSQCHMLSYLHVASTEGIVVVKYIDEAEGVLETRPDGGGALTEAVLRPRVVLAAGSTDEQVALAASLHARAAELCFIANSVSFSVTHEPTTEVAPS